MLLFKIALRNVLRNGRRSLMTGLAIAAGAVALVLLGEYRGTAMLGLETGYVQGMGHLAVFRKGYSDFGSGNPEAYSIAGYESVIRLIEGDAELKPLLRVVTPAVALGGIAGNAALDRSKTFFGSGFVPSDRDRMRRWDEYLLFATERYSRFPLTDGNIDHGIVGKGLARILGLCTPGTPGCPPPRLDLLSGAGGAPNVVAFYVNTAQSQGSREMDDSYVGMHIALAQQLLYGRGERKATSILVQLKRTEDMAVARARLETLFVRRHLDLEVRDFNELSPAYGQITSALQAIFVFVSVTLGLVVLFTVANTVGMNVMERTVEIGTSRAMGARRSRVWGQFLLEGAVIGVMGASAGLVLAAILTVAVNAAGITYMMPVSASPIPLYLMTQRAGVLRAGVWLALVLMAIVASLFPASRAARMTIVGALGHV